MPDIFLSYAREDQATARRFAEAFEREGFSVWWDATLNPGEAFDEVTEKALAEARAVVVLWSKQSVASRWVRAEATQAHESRTLVPVMIEPCKRPIMFELTHTADLTRWNGDPGDPDWQAYLAGVRRFMNKDSRGAPAPVPAQLIGEPPRYSHWLAVAMAIAAILVTAVYWVAKQHGPASGAGATATAAPAAVPARAGVVTLAVLPFADMSPAHDQEYFSDGLSEEILNQLAQIKALRVTGRTSSFSFKGRNEDLRVIGEKLGVGNLLEGSIRKDGNQLRITAQLINAADGARLWSQTYDRELSKVFAVQEDVAKDVAKALSIKLDVGELSRAQGGTTDVEAYDKYLRARKLFQQRGRQELLLSAQLYREALTLDPQFAAAWNGLYSALVFTLTYIPENSAAALKEMAEASMHIAALAPHAWWIQTLRADQFVLQHRWSEAQSGYKAALASAPASEIDVILSYGTVLTAVGRVQEAVDYYIHASQMDPLSLGVSGSLQGALDLVGRRDEAQAEYERSRDLPGDHTIWDWRALGRLWSHKNAVQADAEAQLRVVLKHENPPMALTRNVADRLGNKEAVLAAIRQAFKDPSSQNGSRMSVIANVADHFGDKDLVLAALRRSLVELHFPNPVILWMPSETGFRADPRFKEIARDVGLVDYWRSSGNWGDFCKPVGADDFECH